jgi:hypothetical protein
MGIVTLDTINLATFGAFILKGGDFDLFSFPERKNPPINDWFESDGLDCDLSEVFFEAKTVKIKYYLTAANTTEFNQHLNAFETLHKQPGYRQLYIADFNRTFELRTLEFLKLDHKGGLAKQGKKSAEIEVSYSMDDPLQYFTSAVLVPTLNRATLSQVTLNGYDFSKFGVVIQQAYNSTVIPASPKLGIVYNSNYANGQTADVSYAPKNRSRKLTIECTLLTATYAEFETNYIALFNQLTKPGQIEIGYVNGVIPCYYSAMKDFKKEKPLSNGARVTFKLELITL